MNQFVVIGPGRMGTALTLALNGTGHNVVAAVHPHPDHDSCERYRAITGVDVLGWEEAAPHLQTADVILITVPDKAVTETAQTLAETASLHAGQIVVHTAGSQSHHALWPVAALGVERLCLHPLQTVANPTQAMDLLKGACCTLDGDDHAVAEASTWVRQWHGIPVRIRPEQRPAYHAAAVLASNALVALAAVASELSGIPDGLTALLPLMRGAVANLAQVGLPDALTGPVERGDVATVEAHIQALQNNPTALSVYAALGEATANVARSKGSISEEQRDAFHQRFQSILGGMSCG